jgi:pSer/pThr/pTyr-binding forkhead associated (FHA) protein
MDNGQDNALAKIVWSDPHTGATREYVLQEGTTATIGRSSSNDIHIPEQHVSRQHTVVNYRDGIFMVSDLGSANGTFVNDMKVEEPYPLMVGDEIRLFVPTLKFLAATNQDAEDAEDTGRFIAFKTGEKATLTVTNGPQEGHTYALLLDDLQVGRATLNATWEIVLQDPTVSRPHARLIKEDNQWTLHDLGSANGTAVNSTPVTSDTPRKLKAGDTIAFGATMTLFRIGYEPSDEYDSL